MQFNSDTSNQDLVSQTNFYCGTTNSDYSVNDKTRNLNIAYHEAAQIIQGADGTWQWDDSNNTTLPFGTTDLTSSQQDYGIDDGMLEIERVEVKDSSGNWRLLIPKDQIEIDVAYLAYQNTTGMPLYYDKIGQSLFLFPAPNYSSTDGLRVQFKRAANPFSVADTTKSPGFNARFHDFLPLSASLTYCMLYKPDRAANLLTMKQIMMKQMELFYSRRSKDEPQKMTPMVHNTK